MRIGIIGPLSRISGSTKIAFNQSTYLVKRGHEVNLVLQKRGIEPVKKLYTGLAEEINLVELPTVPFFSSIFDILTLRYRKILAGMYVPITQDVWYEAYLGRYAELRRISRRKRPATRAVHLDLAALLLRSPHVSKLLVKWGCTALICYATLMTVPVLQLYAFSTIKKALYLLDMPLSKTLVTEGRSPQSAIVKAVVKFEKWAINNSDAMACSSKLHSRQWSEWYGTTLKVIPPGCTPSPHFPSEKSKYALTVTYWNPDKRPFFFLELADRLKESDLSLVMAGHWPNKRDLEEMMRRIKQKNLETEIVIIPDPTEEDLNRLYRHASCFVAPPKSGGYMMGALEAASFGTPIIYPKVAGAWDIFTPGVHGLVANIEDIENVVACIRKFEDVKSVHRIGRKIWSRAKELSWEAHASAVEKLLSE